MSRRRIRGDLGSLTVELVVIAPILLVVALTMLIFGRVSASRQEVVEASRAGAQTAAVMSNANSAQLRAAVDAAVGISDRGHTCTNPQIVTDTSQFHPGGYVTVTVTCHVELSDIAVPGMPGSTTVQASATAPIDPYRAVG
jgi:Flp pilus assembly protein TadG